MNLMDFEYCAGWSPELKSAAWRRYRAECRVRNLESALDHIAPDAFDVLMDQIEAARKELIAAGMDVINARSHMAQSDHR